MLCPGALTAPSVGSVLGGLSSACPDGSVLVGADWSYTDPFGTLPAGFTAKRADPKLTAPARAMVFGSFLGEAPTACKATSDCTPPQVCTNGTCVSPQPVWSPGTVQGASAIYCASAADVAAGRATASTATRISTPGFTQPTGRKTATSICQGGAVSGATLWLGPSGGAEQVQLQCTALDANQGAELSASVPVPALRMLNSKAKPTSISTLGTKPAALFASALAQGQQGNSLDGLAFGCQDYRDVLLSPTDQLFGCCTGTAANSRLCGANAPQSPSCDAAVAQACAGDCSPNGGCLHAQCGCLGSPVQQPQCYDSRCADTAGTYMTAAMVQQKGGCPASVACPLWQVLGNGQYLAKGVAAPGCKAPAPSIFTRPAMIAFIVIVIFLVFLAFIIGGSSKSSKRAPIFAPPPPSDIFT